MLLKIVEESLSP